MSTMDTFRSKVYLGTDSVYLRPEFDFMNHARVGANIISSLSLSDDWKNYYSMIGQKHGLTCERFIGYLANTYILNNINVCDEKTGEYGIDVSAHYDIKTGEYEVDAGALYSMAKIINGVADKIQPLTASSVTVKPKTLQTVDLGGQPRFDFVKKNTSMTSPGRYAVLIRNMIKPNDQRSIIDFSNIQSSLGSSSSQVLTVLNTHLDELINVSDPLGTRTKLVRHYKAMDYYRGNGIADLLSNAKGQVTVLGNYLESARPCLNFYNCQPSFLSLKFLLDFPDDSTKWKYVRALVFGSGEHGKTSFIKANLYNQQEHIKMINYFDKPLISEVDQWLKTGVTVGCEFFNLLAFKEMFYKDYLKTNFDISSAPLSIDVTSRIASGLFPEALGIDVSDCPNPNRAFYPNPKNLINTCASWNSYADLASRCIKSVSDFTTFFGLSEHEVIARRAEGKLNDVAEVISLPEESVTSCISRLNL